MTDTHLKKYLIKSATHIKHFIDYYQDQFDHINQIIAIAMFTFSGFHSVSYYKFDIVDIFEILRHRQVNKFLVML